MREGCALLPPPGWGRTHSSCLRARFRCKAAWTHRSHRHREELVPNPMLPRRERPGGRWRKRPGRAGETAPLRLGSRLGCRVTRVTCHRDGWLSPSRCRGAPAFSLPPPRPASQEAPHPGCGEAGMSGEQHTPAGRRVACGSQEKTWTCWLEAGHRATSHHSLGS